ncbi:MAG: autotransporter domain-containing protein [Opitutaceae bacterium]|nr:autotransporter domain-containing protein [Opitutaceae bacterium]
MKHSSLPATPRRLAGPLAAILAIAGLLPPARAEVITEDTRVLLGEGVASLTNIGSNLYEIADGVTITHTRFGVHTSAPGFMTISGNSLTYRPLNQTGLTVFENIRTLGIGGVFTMGAGSTLNITNGIFRNNRGGTTPAVDPDDNGDGVSGVIHAQQATASVYLKDVIFENNGGFGNTGISRVSGTFVMEGGGIYNTFAAGDHTGAINMNAATSYVSLTGAAVDSNRARSYAGVISVAASGAAAIFNNVTFTNNWAGYRGGVVYSNQSSGTVLFKITADGGASSYSYTGNFAGNLNSVNQPDPALTMNDPQVVDNAPAFTPLARGGGFLFVNGASLTEFDIGVGASLTIGAADAASRAYDTLAANNAGSQILKSGEGGLILNADNSYWRGLTTVAAGRLLLGNDEAQFGGVVTVDSGAIFGGAGTLATWLYSTSNTAAPDAGPSAVNATAGSTLQVGLRDRRTAGLTVTGTLSLADATIAYAAFDGTHAARLNVTGSLVTAGTNTINLQAFKSGAYHLGNIQDSIVANGADSLRYAVNGLVVSGNGRQTVARDDSYTDELVVDLVTDTARAMKWTGAGGTTWNDAELDWVAVNNAGIGQYSAADTVQFADAGGAITLEGSLPVSNMEVTGAGLLAFTGAGGITATPWEAAIEAEAAVQTGGLGRLIKAGSGTLVFNNDGMNNFNAGVELRGGVIEIQRGDQLRTSGGVLALGMATTLRVRGAGAGDNSTAEEMNNKIAIEGAAAISTVNGHVRLNGSISGGRLVKTGNSTLILAGANDHEATDLAAGGLALHHDQALGRGALNVLADDSPVGIAGNVTVGNDINFGGFNLLVYNPQSGAAARAPAGVLAGSLNGVSLTVSVPNNDSDPNRGPVTLAGDNTLNSVRVRQYATLVAAHAGALGGGGSDVTVADGGALHLTVPGVTAGNVVVQDGGTLGFDRPRVTGVLTMLATSGAVTIEEGARLAILSRLTSGYTTLIHAGGGLVLDPFTLTVDAGPNNAVFRVYADEDNNLVCMNMNRAGNPGKDIAVSLDAMSTVASAVHSRVTEHFLMPLAEFAPGDGTGNSFWVKGLGSIGRYDDNATRIGYKDTTYGFATGFDRIYLEKYLLGLHAGYSYSDLKTDNHATTDAIMPHIGAYGAARFGKFYLSADVLGGAFQADTTRIEDAVTGRYKAAMFGASAEAGLLLRTWENGGVRPFAGIHYMRYSYKDHAEKGPGAIFIDDFKADRLESLVGAQLTHSFMTAWKKPAMLTLHAGWRAALNSEQTELNVVFADMYVYEDYFKVLSDVYSRDRITVGAGLRASLTDASVFTLDYECESARDHIRHNLNAIIRWSW